MPMRKCAHRYRTLRLSFPRRPRSAKIIISIKVVPSLLCATDAATVPPLSAVSHYTSKLTPVRDRTSAPDTLRRCYPHPNLLSSISASIPAIGRSTTTFSRRVFPQPPTAIYTRINIDGRPLSCSDYPAKFTGRSSHTRHMKKSHE